MRFTLDTIVMTLAIASGLLAPPALAQDEGDGMGADEAGPTDDAGTDGSDDGALTDGGGAGGDGTEPLPEEPWDCETAFDSQYCGAVVVDNPCDDEQMAIPVALHCIGSDEYVDRGHGSNRLVRYFREKVDEQQAMRPVSDEMEQVLRRPADFGDQWEAHFQDVFRGIRLQVSNYAHDLGASYRDGIVEAYWTAALEAPAVQAAHDVLVSARGIGFESCPQWREYALESLGVALALESLTFETCLVTESGAYTNIFRYAAAGRGAIAEVTNTRAYAVIEAPVVPAAVEPAALFAYYFLYVRPEADPSAGLPALPALTANFVTTTATPEFTVRSLGDEFSVELETYDVGQWLEEQLRR